MIPYLVHGWTEDDRCASKDWKNTEYHTCEFERTRYVLAFQRVGTASGRKYRGVQLLTTICSDGEIRLIETPQSRERRLRHNTAESGHVQFETANI
jgi:hypothetical protein